MENRSIRHYYSIFSHNMPYKKAAKKQYDTISVIIPCYNCSSTIRSCLTSVINQTYLSLEIILVDDCSSDSTSEQIAKFMKEHRKYNIRYLKNELNKGPGFSRNFAIMKSTGSLIAFLDSDDVWHPKKCEIIANIFLRNPNCYLLAHKQKILPSVEKNIKLKKSNIKLSNIHLQNLIFSNIIPTSSVVIKRDCIKKIKFKNKLYAEDYLFWLEILKLGFLSKFIHLPLSFSHRPLYSPGGFSGSLRIHELREIESIKFFCKKYNISRLIKIIWIFWSILKYYKRCMQRI